MNETLEQTTIKLRPYAEEFIYNCYGHGSDEAEEFYWRWNAPDATWTGRHRLVMYWLHMEQQATRNGGLRNGGAGRTKTSTTSAGHGRG